MMRVAHLGAGVERGSIRVVSLNKCWRFALRRAAAMRMLDTRRKKRRRIRGCRRNGHVAKCFCSGVCIAGGNNRWICTSRATEPVNIPGLEHTHNRSLASSVIIGARECRQNRAFHSLARLFRFPLHGILES